MSQNVAANFTLPAVLDTLKSTSAAAKANTSKADTSSSSTSNASTSSVETTFLNLLVKELQNQDPTDPMDSTAMVGQMISLNQLDQLISINQALGGSATSATNAVQSPSVMAKTAMPAATNAMQTQAASTQLPFDPNTLMPTGIGINADSAAGFLNLPFNASWMNSSRSNNTISGGK